MRADSKPKRGRPRRTGPLASERVTVRLTKDERAKMERAAAPLSLSEWLRDLGLAAVA